MKLSIRSLAATLAMIAMPLTITSCSSGGDEGEGVQSGDVQNGGITAQEFASGAAIYNAIGVSFLLIRPVSSDEKVDASDTQARSVQGWLETSEASIPVVFSYTTVGDPLTSEILTAEISVSLVNASDVTNADLLAMLGAPSDGKFETLTITVDYLSQTLRTDAEVMIPITTDPDIIGDGDQITGQFSPFNYEQNMDFYYGETAL